MIVQLKRFLLVKVQLYYSGSTTSSSRSRVWYRYVLYYRYVLLLLASSSSYSHTTSTSSSTTTTTSSSSTTSSTTSTTSSSSSRSSYQYYYSTSSSTAVTFGRLDRLRLTFCARRLRPVATTSHTPRPAPPSAPQDLLDMLTHVSLPHRSAPPSLEARMVRTKSTPWWLALPRVVGCILFRGYTYFTGAWHVAGACDGIEPTVSTACNSGEC